MCSEPPWLCVQDCAASGAAACAELCEGEQREQVDQAETAGADRALPRPRGQSWGVHAAGEVCAGSAELRPVPARD